MAKRWEVGVEMEKEETNEELWWRDTGIWYLCMPKTYGKF